MQELRYGYFPKAFVVAGRRYDVQAVEQCWTVSQPGGQGEHRLFRVRCRQERFELCQDVRDDTWYLQRLVA